MLDMEDKDYIGSDTFKYMFRNKGETVKHMAVTWELLKLMVVWSDNTIKTYDLSEGNEGFMLGSVKSVDDIKAFDTNGRYSAAATDKGIINV